MMRGGFYYKEDAWDVVTITKDNFLDYYEFRVSTEFQFDDVWGEYESTRFNYNLVLKDEYRNRIAPTARNFPTVKVKYSYAEYQAKFTVDPEAETYTITPTNELIWNQEGSYKGLSSFYVTFDIAYKDAETISYPMDIQILNAEGMFFLAKD